MGGNRGEREYLILTVADIKKKGPENVKNLLKLYVNTSFKYIIINKKFPIKFLACLFGMATLQF